MAELLGIGICAVGRVDPKPQCRLHPERCADHDHPGVTYNPWQDRTWCLCGDVIRDGNTITWPKADGHDGPLHTCPGGDA